MDIYSVLALVEVKVRAGSKSEANLKVKAANPLRLDSLKTIESARTVFTKNIPNGGAVPNFLAALGSASELIEEKVANGKKKRLTNTMAQKPRS